MKASEKQLLFLLTVLKGTLGILNTVGGYDTETRKVMYDQIVNQQSDGLKDLDPDGPNGHLT